MKYKREPLTPRLEQVVRLLSLGCTVREAAAVLELVPSTVENYKTRAMRRLGVNKMALLTRVAIKLRITSLDECLTPAEKRRSGRKQDGWN